MQHTPVAVKILKEGEVCGALGSVATAGEQDLKDIRKNLVRVPFRILLLLRSTLPGVDAAVWYACDARRLFGKVCCTLLAGTSCRPFKKALSGCAFASGQSSLQRHLPS